LLPPHVDIIDGNAGTVRHLMNRLEQTKQLNDNSVSFPVTFLSSKGTVEDINRLKLAFAKIQS
jgi:glutamate racemase